MYYYCMVLDDMDKVPEKESDIRSPGFVVCRSNTGWLVVCSSTQVTRKFSDIFIQQPGSYYGENSIVLHAVDGMKEIRNRLADNGITLVEWFAPFTLWYASDCSEAVDIPLSAVGFEATVIPVKDGVWFWCNTELTAKEIFVRLTQTYDVVADNSLWTKLYMFDVPESDYAAKIKTVLESVGFTVVCKNEPPWI